MFSGRGIVIDTLRGHPPARTLEAPRRGLELTIAEFVEYSDPHHGDKAEHVRAAAQNVRFDRRPTANCDSSWHWELEPTTQITVPWTGEQTFSG
jgi:hypothetical protein